MIKILAVAGTTAVSKLIMWSTGTNVSHMAFGYDLSEDGRAGIVFEATVTGCKVSWQKDFWATHEPRYEIRIPCEDADKKAEFFQFINENDGTGYDFVKLAADGFYTVRHKVLGVDIPDKTTLEEKNALLCNDLAGKLPNWIYENPPGMDAIRNPMQTILAIAAQHSEWEFIDHTATIGNPEDE